MWTNRTYHNQYILKFLICYEIRTKMIVFLPSYHNFYEITGTYEKLRHKQVYTFS